MELGFLFCWKLCWKSGLAADHRMLDDCPESRKIQKKLAKEQKNDANMRVSCKKIKKKIDAWTSLCYSDMANGRA